MGRIDEWMEKRKKGKLERLEDMKSGRTRGREEWRALAGPRSGVQHHQAIY